MLSLPDFAIITAISFLLMSIAWVYQLLTRNSNLIDVCWSLGIGVCAAYALILHTPATWSARAVLILGIAWSLRLGLHLLWNRIIRDQREDSRYHKLRVDYGQSYNRFLLFFAWFQALLIPLFAIPFFVLFPAQQEYPILTACGLILAGCSLTGLYIADHQLQRWKNNPDNAGKTCRQGLWRYSRHPNYFFEWLLWCSYPIMCWPYDYGWLALLVPALELFLLLKVTGIPYTERCSLEHRDDYRAYQQSTSAFFPWFKRKDA